LRGSGDGDIGLPPVGGRGRLIGNKGPRVRAFMPRTVKVRSEAGLKGPSPSGGWAAKLIIRGTLSQIANGFGSRMINGGRGQGGRVGWAPRHEGERRLEGPVLQGPNGRRQVM